VSLRSVVIGAGPIGLEAALALVERGHEVTVLERDVVGASLLRWGPTRFFSPFGMNVSKRVLSLLGSAAPSEDALLTGPEHVDRVLRPVAASLALRERTAVVSVGRTRLIRKDMPRHPVRFERSFTLLVEGPRGEETIEADVVLDAGGASVPCHIGSGGVWAKGERRVEGRIITTLGALHDAIPMIRGKRALLVGHGHSAANAIELLSRIAAEHPSTRVVWATRSLHKRPVIAVADDPLPERKKIVDRANDLAQSPPPFLAVERRAHVEELGAEVGGFGVHLSGGRYVEVDAIVAFTGYRPDLSILSELAVEVSAVTEGAAGIHRALSNVTDCLSVPALAPADLFSGEDRFFLIGHKSYGRSSAFLLRDGIRQLETIVESLPA
jgi:hypothetical protein